MEDDWIQISQLNDFIFCPASIYFHNLYGRQAVLTYQSPDQLKGTAAHSAIDQRRYSTHKNILQSLFVESSTYGLIGKIDLFDSSTKTLIERKKQIKTIYDGYIFQIYGQYFCMIEMGFQVDHLQLYSLDDHRKYDISLPKDDQPMFQKFEQLLKEMRQFSLSSFKQQNQKKCLHCIYEPACDRSLL
ncbi:MULTISPECIES: type V CRISPR-associated protein Cas4 [Acidaminococcus]|uniref:type V CRISPR-associated protein Cas4 n=1 Tax=Acidaminococcus TaxID=904 RepID=UPI000688C41B|nr:MULTISPECIES: type V CRISPR-associated protein Cas4 [Acidaminococcus]RJU38775.1 type V CRISPR-associated protein Cas4 [Acidaminococcus sp. AM33-14BH]